MIGLDNWWFTASSNRLYGCRPDGKCVFTSRVKKVNGNEVTTLSGTIYKLLTPHPDYTQWCIDNNYHVPTEAEPIILR
jgi:hypothetical protein